MPNKNKTIYHTWNIVVIFAAIYAAIMAPLDFAYEAVTVSGKPIYQLISVIFMVDFLLNAYIFSSRKKARCIELEDQGWYKFSILFTDLLAAIPFALFNASPFFILFRLFKLPRLYNLLGNWLHSLVKYAGIFLFVSFSFWFLIFTHIIACGWHSIHEQEQNIDMASSYINDLYWTITTLTTVGYGDITPITNPQKIYAICVQVFGFGVLTFIIGAVASQLVRKDPARVRYEENMDGLTSLMHYRTLPKSMRSKIVDFYKHMWRNRLGYDETQFLRTLPENLQTEVGLYLKKDVIEKVSIFKNASDLFKQEIALSLKPIFLTPGDCIFKAGDEGDKMYFVVNGELNTLTQSEDKILTQLNVGDYFGEIALFKNQARSATVKALTYCDIYSLDKASFDKLISKYPRVIEEIRKTVEKRESKYSN